MAMRGCDEGIAFPAHSRPVRPGFQYERVMICLSGTPSVSAIDRAFAFAECPPTATTPIALIVVRMREVIHPPM